MTKDIELLLGKRLKRLRKRYNYTQKELAEKADIDYKYIQNLEGKNPSSATIATLKKISKVFKITPSKLINFYNKGS